MEASTESGKVLLLPLFDDIIRSRNKRIFQSRSHIPKILKYTLVFADVIMIILSLFIGVRLMAKVIAKAGTEIPI